LSENDARREVGVVLALLEHRETERSWGMRSRVGLMLVLGVALCGQAIADDTRILAGGNLVPTSETLPPQVEAQLQMKLAPIKQQIADLKRQLGDLNALHANDEKAYAEQLASEQTKADDAVKALDTKGFAGKLDDPNSKPVAKPTGPSAPSAASPWWQMANFDVMRGLGRGLQPLADARMSVIAAQANAVSAQVGDENPQLRGAIASRVQGVVKNAAAPATEQSAAVRVLPSGRQFVPLPTVTDENGTHPMINLTLGD
jgi:hypothetical protein